LFWTFLGYLLTESSSFNCLHVWVIEFFVIAIIAAIICAVGNKN